MKDLTLFEINTHTEIKSDFGLYYCGKRINTQNHIYGPEIRKHYLFVFVNKGEAVLHTKKGDIPFGTGDLLIMFPGEKIHYTTSTSWNIQWVGLYGESIDKFMKQLNVDKSHPIVSVVIPQKIEKILEDLYMYSKENTYSSEFMQTSLIYSFFAALFEQVNVKNIDDYVCRAKKIIDYNYDIITVDKLSKSLHLNPSYLSRIFRKKEKISPKQYILNQKMERAKSLLLTDLPLTEISSSVGFSDSLYFSRIFKQYEGINPTVYRKQHKDKT